MEMFKKILSVMCTTLLIMFIVLPFVSGETNIPDASAHTVGTLLHQFISYWKEVASLI